MLDLAAKTVSSGPKAPKRSIDSVYALHRKYGTLRRFPKGSFVFTKGSVPVGSYFIENGLLKVCQFTEEGRDVTFFIRKTGDAFGLAEIVLGQNHPCYAQCLHDSQIWVLDAAIIQEKIHSDHEVMSDILYTMTDRLIHHQSTVELLISKPVPWRLAWLLQQLGTPVGDSDSRIDLVLNHEEISNMIGCSRQTVSELLSKWKAQGIISYDRKHIVLHNVQAIFGASGMN
ncbi:Crp/Fnr family transcriptional regulator [Paenibacillus sp. Aloe-11]|uniref:Crp/Fnr family transcriptional regulator n=1 Tax=Paenibacillus sp. Aloe-11 TaxID=1050222 RepID=UPI00024EF5BE|nr:Crp/Fnr family transcriptional regulator [Paenibacillus sp. Aloe-11]EHS57989.1 transcriptional regulator, Crp/Fnr family [Paenibacillus sp. Aloe-11]